MITPFGTITVTTEKDEGPNINSESLTLHTQSTKPHPHIVHSNPRLSECKCGKMNDDTPSCCAPGGDWSGKCGSKAQGKAYTWMQGENACKGEISRHL